MGPTEAFHTGDFFLCGWRVRSELPFPDLLPWTNEEDISPDITIAAGAVPDAPTDVVLQTPLLLIGRDQSCWFTVPRIATFFINSDATRVLVSADGGDPGIPAVRLFLLDTVLALLCYKRGLLPIHASCVDIGGQAVAFTGASCAGKSLLAAACVKAGCLVLSDDVTVIDTAAPTGPFVRPAFPRLRLWRDAVDELGFANAAVQRSRPELDKYDVSFENSFVAGPRRLAAVYHLRRSRKASAAKITRLYGARAVQDAMHTLYCGQAGRTLAGTAGMQALAALCSGAPSYLLESERGLEKIAPLVQTLLEQHKRRL